MFNTPFSLGMAICLVGLATSSLLFLVENNELLVPGSDRDTRICSKIVIAHRGASGYVPEHTLGAYALAATMDADYIEPDLVSTSDGFLVAIHDNELSMTTDVRTHPEFATRFRTQTIDGVEKSGWFTEDFTLAELKTLRVIERIPTIRPGNARMDGSFTIPTIQEILDLVRGLQVSMNRTIGVYPEIKHSTHFQRISLPMEMTLVQTLHKNGYSSAQSPVYIQSLKVTNLQQLCNITKLKLIQLMARNQSEQPADQLAKDTGLTYGDMATPKGLQEIAKYASAVGPDKTYIIPRDEKNQLGESTSFVADSHAAGLQVHPYTFRAENVFLPVELQSDFLPFAYGDFEGELKAYFDAGVDGLFSDQPDMAVRARGQCTKQKQ